MQEGIKNSFKTKAIMKNVKTYATPKSDASLYLHKSKIFLKEDQWSKLVAELSLNIYHYFIYISNSLFSKIQ